MKSGPTLHGELDGEFTGRVRVDMALVPSLVLLGHPEDDQHPGVHVNRHGDPAVRDEHLHSTND